MTPNEATDRGQTAKVRQNLYGVNNRLRADELGCTKDYSFEVGDYVKLSKHALIYDKGYKPNWMLENMVVTEVIPTDPVVYRVKDLDGEEIKGAFYEFELQKVTSLPKTYDIEKVIKEKDNKIFVKWKGYPEKFNGWILKTSVKTKQ